MQIFIKLVKKEAILFGRRKKHVFLHSVSGELRISRKIKTYYNEKDISAIKQKKKE